MFTFYLSFFFLIISNSKAESSQLTQDTELDHERLLAYNYYGGKYGSPVLPITNYGNEFFTVQIPISSAERHVPLTLMPYSDRTWFSSIKNLPLDRILLGCDFNTEEITINYDSFSARGKICHHSSQINHEQTLIFNYLYVFTTDYKPKSLTSGGLGLGISKDSFPVSIKSRVENKHSIYLSNNQDAYSHILFGGQDPRFYEPGLVISLKPADVTSWTFMSTAFGVRINGQGLASYNVEKNVILDPNFPNIHVPKSEIDVWIDRINKAAQSSCGYDTYARKIACNCKDIENIDEFVFSFSGKNISFPKSVLVTDSYPSCYIRISGTGSSKNDFGHYPVSKYYQDHVIFGAVFMTYYYTVFSYSSKDEGGKLDLYVAIPNAQRPPIEKDVVQNYSKDIDWISTLIMGASIIFSVWGVVYFYKAIRNECKKNKPNRPVEFHLESNRSKISTGDSTDRDINKTRENVIRFEDEY